MPLFLEVRRGSGHGGCFTPFQALLYPQTACQLEKEEGRREEKNRRKQKTREVNYLL